MVKDTVVETTGVKAAGREETWTLRRVSEACPNGREGQREETADRHRCDFVVLGVLPRGACHRMPAVHTPAGSELRFQVWRSLAEGIKGCRVGTRTGIFENLLSLPESIIVFCTCGFKLNNVLHKQGTATDLDTGKLPFTRVKGRESTPFPVPAPTRVSRGSKNGCRKFPWF